MTRQTSKPEALYQQTPILIDTLADHIGTSKQDVADLLVFEASEHIGNTDEAALQQVMHDYIITEF